MPLCPKCGSNLRRIHRRPVDRALSLAYPVSRFRCSNHDCRWQGNMAETGKAKQRLLEVLAWPLMFFAIYILVKKVLVR